MDGNAKAPHGRNGGLQERRTIRAEQSQPQYNNETELIQDVRLLLCVKLAKERAVLSR